MLVALLPSQLHGGATPLAGFAARFRGFFRGNIDKDSDAVEVRHMPALATATLLPNVAFALPGCEQTHGLWLPSAASDADIEVGNVVGSVLALMTAKNLSLRCHTGYRWGVLANNYDAHRTASLGICEQVAQRLADKGCALTAHRHAAGGIDGQPASVVIVDRTMDLVGSSSVCGSALAGQSQEHGCILDKLLTALPRRRQHSNQLHISLSAASPIHLIPDRYVLGIVHLTLSLILPKLTRRFVCRLPGSSASLGGSLFHPTNDVACNLLRAAMLSPEPDAQLVLQRALLSALGVDGIDVATSETTDGKPTLGAVSSAQLRQLAERLATDRIRAYRHSPLLELAAAMLYVLAPDQSMPQSFDLIVEAERMFLAMLGQAPQTESLLQTLIEIMTTDEGAVHLSLAAIVQLLIFVYSASMSHFSYRRGTHNKRAHGRAHQSARK